LCARFTLRTRPSVWIAELSEALSAVASGEWLFDSVEAEELSAADWQPRFNIAPTQGVWGLCSGYQSQIELRQLRWGFVPSWTDDLSMGQRMINGRSETLHEKPAFRSAFRERRCVLPADGYLEWTTEPNGKQPHLIERRDREVFFLAGLWEQNRKVTADDTVITSCTIATTSANETTAALHDRMPVLLDPERAASWLTHLSDRDLLQPAPEDWLMSTPVSRRVNSPRHDDEDCLRRSDKQQRLF